MLAEEILQVAQGWGIPPTHPRRAIRAPTMRNVSKPWNILLAYCSVRPEVLPSSFPTPPATAAAQPTVLRYKCSNLSLPAPPGCKACMHRPRAPIPSLYTTV